jgi:hypothetical protein
MLRMTITIVRQTFEVTARKPETTELEGCCSRKGVHRGQNIG